jgi:uncharacterized membrane protein required for colicin V production
MRLRALVFLIIAVVLLFVVKGSFRLFDVHAEWYHELGVAVVLALGYSFYPVTGSRVLALIPETPLAIIAMIEFLIYSVVCIIACALEIVLALAIFTLAGVLLIGGGYYTAGILGASIGTILLIALILLTGRRSYQITRRIVEDTWSWFWELAEKIAEWWFPFPERLMDKVWEIATKFGESMGEISSEHGSNLPGCRNWLQVFLPRNSRVQT